MARVVQRGRSQTRGTRLVTAALAAAPPARTHHDADAEISALARSVAVPGLHARITAYADQTLTKEPA